MQYKIPKYALPVFLFWFCLFTFAQSSAVDVKFSDGLLTLQIEDIPLNEVIDAVSTETGIKTKYLIDTAELPRINASFDNAKLEDVFDFLLKDINRLIIYDSTGSLSEERNISQVWIFGMDSRKMTETDLLAQELNKLDSKQRSEALLGIVSGNHLASNETAGILSESLMNDHNVLVRTRAAVGLAELNNEHAVPALIKALSDESQSVRSQAMLALGKIGTEQAIKALGDILQESTNSEDRNLAVRALRNSDSQLAGQFLDLATHDSNSQVRESSVQSSSARSMPQRSMKALEY